MESQQTTPILLPFDEGFICAHCGYLDKGKYCSECSQSLLIDDEEVQKSLVDRLITFGYKSFDHFLQEDAEGVRNYDFSDFFIDDLDTLYFLTEGVNGLRINFVLIGPGTLLSPEFINYLSTKVTSKINVINEHINGLNRKERPKEYTEYLEKIDIHYVPITYVGSTYHGKATHIKDHTSNVKTSVGFTFFSNGYGLSRVGKIPLKITVETIVIDLGKRAVETNKSKFYNLLLHNASVILSQTIKSSIAQKPEKDRGFLGKLVFFIFESFIDYFRTLIQFFKSPYFFADLIINKRCIPFTRIINYYLVGLACSVSIPILLTGGYISSDKLTLFSDLPPFVGDMAELSVSVFILFIQVAIMHLVFRIFKHKGNLTYFFLGMLFVQAFFQLIDRPYEYFIGVPLSNLMFDLGAGPQYARTLGYINSAYMLVYFILYYPIVRTAYKVTPTFAVTAYSVPAVFFLGLQFLATKDIPFTNQTIAKNSFHSIMDTESTFNDHFTGNLTPLLQLGDNTGNYKQALEKIPEIKQEMLQLTTRCHEYNEKHQTPYTLGVCTYFQSKYTYIVALERGMKGEITFDSVNTYAEKVSVNRKKIASIPETY